MAKFQNKYRITTTRLQNWDYGSNGAYFITICTHNREHYFGEIISNNTSSNVEQFMQLNEIGLLAKKYWLEIPKQFPYVELGNFVIMPDHTHGILIINHRPPIVDSRLIANQQLVPEFKSGGFAGTKNPMLNDNISRIIRWYKGRCSFEIRKIRTDFKWQSRFYDHIIRNSKSFENIQNYTD